MRLAFLSNKDPSIPEIDSDGGAVTVRHYAIELAKIGYDIDVFTPKLALENTRNDYEENKARAQSDNIVTLESKINVFRLPIRQVNRGIFKKEEIKDLPGILESFLFADSFERERLKHYDLINLFHPLTGFGVLGREMIDLDRTILFPMLLSEYYLKYQFVSGIYCDLENSLLSQVGHISSPSQDEVKTLIKKGISRKKINIVHRGINRDIFTHKIREESIPYGTVKIVCTNAIRPQKGQHQLVYTARLLKDRGLNPEILFVGENKRFYKPEHEEYYLNLLRLAENLEVKSNVKFLGAAEPQKIAEILKSSHLAVFPSETESFGKAPLEAIATGTPTILGDDVPAYREFARNGINAIFVKRTPEAFADTIRFLMTDKDKYLKLNRSSVGLNIQFSWEKVTSDLDLFYTKILSKRRK